MDINKKVKEIYKKVHISYYVMFKYNFNSEVKYNPILEISSDENFNSMGQGCHLLDPELNERLPALRYILHLPRIGFDTVDINSESALNSNYDCPHEILMFPSSSATSLSKLPRSGHSLLIYDDLCEAEAHYFKNENFIDIIPISRLSSKTLIEHWRKIGNLMKPLENEECIPGHMELLKGDKILAVPQLFILNHIVRSDQLFKLKSDGLELFKELYKLCFKTHCDIRMINENELQYSEIFRIYFSWCQCG